MIARDPALSALLDRARATAPMTAEQLRAQRRSFVAGEAAFGSDADEAAYAAAAVCGDVETLRRLDAEGEARRQQALANLDQIG